MDATGLLNAAVNLALIEHAELHKQWITAYATMTGRYGVFPTHQADCRTDMLLRRLERERAVIIEKDLSDVDFSFDMQMALSRYWMFSAYEMLRMARQLNRVPGDEALNQLLEKFTLVRIPLAKNEIAFTNRKQTGEIMLLRDGDHPSQATAYEQKAADYIPGVFVDRDTGSVGWKVVHPQIKANIQLTRRTLSDELLALLS
jgi:hypothetical protein